MVSMFFPLLRCFTMWGNDPPCLGCNTPHTTASSHERGGSIIRCGVCVIGRDEVRVVGAWRGLQMYSVLSQIAY